MTTEAPPTYVKSRVVDVPEALSPLDKRLAEFVLAMKAKFETRAAKHPGQSNVCDPSFDFSALGEMDVWDHYVCEVGELLSARSTEERKKEDVDVANMAFLHWCAHE